MKDITSSGKLTRRRFMKFGTGAAAVGGMALGGWGLTEIIVDKGPVNTWHKSVCRYCGTGCGVMVGMQDGKVTRIRGDQEAHNKGVICIKGAMLAELTQLKNRARTPRIKRNGEFVDASWEEAMSLITEKFKESINDYGAESVAYYGSGQLLIEESYTANKLFKAGLRTNNVDGNPRLCMASAAVGYTQTFGKDEPPGCYADIDHAECFFLIGSNTFECHPPLWERIMIRKKSNPDVKIICVDPRRTKTAVRSDIHLPVVPGTDMLLLNAMAYEFVKNEWIDAEFISNNVKFNDGQNEVTFEDYAKFLDDYAPQKVATALGVTQKQIEEVAYIFANSGATLSMWTMGINQRSQGVFLNNTLNSLHLITKQICKPGASPLSLTGQSNACGGVRDTGALSHILPNGRLVANEKHRNEVEELWGVPKGTIPPRPGLDAVNLFEGMRDEKVKAAIIMCTNPAQSMPDLKPVKEGLEKCFLVVADIFEDTETAKFADVFLPAALWIEKEGVYGQSERRYQLIQKLQDPPGQAKSDFDILVDFANRMGYGSLISYKTPSECWEEYRKFSAASYYNFEGMTRERLKEVRGLQWPCPDVDHPGTPRRYMRGDPFVEEGREIQFYGKPDNRAVVFLRPYIPSPEQLSEDFPVHLTTGRLVEQWHTGTMTDKIASLAEGSGPGVFYLNPQDAQDIGVKEGEEIEVSSSYGTVRAKVKISENETAGVIFAAFYDPNFPINNIVADNYDPVSKEPEYKVTAVSVKKVVEVENL
jgi:nitrate reductase NapA